jgi:ribonuclease BN (tRNA processing enzyme)
MRYSLYVNGYDNAYPKEFGCDCARCCAPTRAANTSMSLIGQDDAGRTAFHALIDCGSGVSDSLSANPMLQGDNARLDWMLFTHWHEDHRSEFNRVCAGWKRSRIRRQQAFERVKLWCREGSAVWMAHYGDYSWRDFVAPVVAPGYDDAGVALAPIPIDQTDLRITPITLSHWSADVATDSPTRRAPACSGFVIETTGRKVVLFWDMDVTNTWIDQPQTDAHRNAIELASNADLLCVDCNTWRFDTLASGRPMSHASFHTHLSWASVLQPEHTWLVHLSGHEDARGDGFGWTDDEWRTRAQVVWQERGMPGTVDVPHIGRVFEI